MVITLDPAVKGEKLLRRVVDQKGPESPLNHAIIYADKDGNSFGVAEGAEILTAMIRHHSIKEVAIEASNQ